MGHVLLKFYTRDLHQSISEISSFKPYLSIITYSSLVDKMGNSSVPRTVAEILSKSDSRGFHQKIYCKLQFLDMLTNIKEDEKDRACSTHATKGSPYSVQWERQKKDTTRKNYTYVG